MLVVVVVTGVDDVVVEPQSIQGVVVVSVVTVVGHAGRPIHSPQQ